jgi:transcriptional regulator with XRE-family HTH domain
MRASEPTKRAPKGRGSVHAGERTKFGRPALVPCSPGKSINMDAHLGEPVGKVPPVADRKPGIMGTNIRRLLPELGLKETEVARRAGIPRSTITALERGDAKEPSWSTVLAIAKGMGVHPTVLTRPLMEAEDLERLIEEYRASPWAATLEPPLSDADIAYVRGDGYVTIAGKRAGPKTIHAIVKLGRSLAAESE